MIKNSNGIKTTHLLQIFVILLLVLFIVSSKDSLFKSDNKNNSDLVTSLAQSTKIFCLDNLETYGSKENCYANEFNKIGEKNGPAFGFQVLDALQNIDPEAKGCHLISHGLGAGSYKKEPDKWRTLIQNMPTICNYGAVHGVIESYVGSLPEKSLKREVVPTICGENPRADCNHIIGHMLLVETDADVDKALDLCEVFTDPQQNNFCISGVFMEYQTALNLVQHKLVPESWLNWSSRLPELEKLCRSYDGKFAEGCWEEIVHVALVKFNNDPKKIFDFCGTAQVSNGAKRCRRHSIGIIGASRNFNLASLKSICTIPVSGDPNFESECYPALVSSSLSTIPTGVPEAISFCQSLDVKFKQSCLSMIESWKAGSNMKNNDL